MAADGENVFNLSMLVKGAAEKKKLEINVPKLGREDPNITGIGLKLRSPKDVTSFYKSLNGMQALTDLEVKLNKVFNQDSLFQFKQSVKYGPHLYMEYKDVDKKEVGQFISLLKKGGLNASAYGMEPTFRVRVFGVLPNAQFKEEGLAEVVKNYNGSTTKTTIKPSAR